MSQEQSLPVEKWQTKQPTNIDEVIDKYRPKVKRVYIDQELGKEVKVYEERWC